MTSHPNPKLQASNADAMQSIPKPALFSDTDKQETGKVPFYQCTDCSQRPWLAHLCRHREVTLFRAAFAVARWRSLQLSLSSQPMVVPN